MYSIVSKNLTIYLYIGALVYPAMKQKPIVSSSKNRLYFFAITVSFIQHVRCHQKWNKLQSVLIAYLRSPSHICMSGLRIVVKICGQV